MLVDPGTHFGFISLEPRHVLKRDHEKLREIPVGQRIAFRLHGPTHRFAVDELFAVIGDSQAFPVNRLFREGRVKASAKDACGYGDA